MDDMLYLRLTRSWCATWLVPTRYGGLYMVGSFYCFLIAFPALQLLCYIGGRDEFLPSPLLFLRYSVNQLATRLYGGAS